MSYLNHRKYTREIDFEGKKGEKPYENVDDRFKEFVVIQVDCVGVDARVEQVLFDHI